MEKLFYPQVEAWTKGLVRTPSIVKGGSESDAAAYVYNELAELDYFKENPENLIMQKTLKDEYDRHSTLALVRGNGRSNRTIVLMGHIDTVEVDDYGPLKDLAFDPDGLKEAMAEMDLDPELRADLDSGAYMFGRGALDMKAGVAGHMALIDYFSKRREDLNGNLVMIAECDEEDGSRGIVSALKILKEWKEDHDLDYVLAINADYSTPYYPGDPNRYVYLGTIGKLLPTFFVAGKETHVGQAFGGYDPNLLMAELTRRINLNPDLSDTALGETTIPPLSLKQEDSKKDYTVQTALYAHGYYNFFTHAMTPGQVLDTLRPLAQEAAREVDAYMEEAYRAWCDKADFPHAPLGYKTPVFTWDEVLEICRAKDPDFDTWLESYKEDLHRRDPEMDLRDYSLEVVRHTFTSYMGDEAPACILYYSSIFSQNIEIRGETPLEKKIVDSLEASVAQVQKTCPDPIKIKYFYPYISDSSFVYLPEDLAGIQALKDNMPAWGTKSTHPVEDIRPISMPAINVGTYGKEGHAKGERVHKDFTFETIPQISLGVIRRMLD